MGNAEDLVTRYRGLGMAVNYFRTSANEVIGPEIIGASPEAVKTWSLLMAWANIKGNAARYAGAKKWGAGHWATLHVTIENVTSMVQDGLAQWDVDDLLLWKSQWIVDAETWVVSRKNNGAKGGEVTQRTARLNDGLAKFNALTREGKNDILHALPRTVQDEVARAADPNEKANIIVRHQLAN